MLGKSIAVSCLFIIATGVMVFLDKPGEKNVLRFVLLGLLIVFTSVLATTMFAGENELSGTSLAANVSELWNNGCNSMGGGLIGGGICRIVNLLVGTAGTWVLTITAEIILIILLTGISIEKLFRRAADTFKRRKSEYDDIADSEVEI